MTKQEKIQAAFETACTRNDVQGAFELRRAEAELLIEEIQKALAAKGSSGKVDWSHIGSMTEAVEKLHGAFHWIK